MILIILIILINKFKITLDYDISNINRSGTATNAQIITKNDDIDKSYFIDYATHNDIDNDNYNDNGNQIWNIYDTEIDNITDNDTLNT